MTKVQRILEHLYQKFHDPKFLYTDPLSIVHEYSDPKDQEVVGLIVAAFAFGNITSIKAFIYKLLKPMGSCPANFLKHQTATQIHITYNQYYYRWLQDVDIALFLYRVGELLRTYDTLESAFFEAPACESELEIKPTIAKIAKKNYLIQMAKFRHALLDISCDEIPLRNRSYTKETGKIVSLRNASDTLFPDPLTGAAKRYHLYLRWMIRPKDGIDLGCWHADPTQLLMPIDTHVFQATKLLRINKHKTANLNLAADLTKRFLRYDPADPIRYDFSLTRPGIMGLKEIIHEIQDTSIE